MFSLCMKYSKMTKISKKYSEYKSHFDYGNAMKMVSSTYTLPHPCAIIKYFEICFQIVRLVRTPYYVASVKNKSVVLSAPFNTFYYTIIRSTESSIFPQSQSIKCEKSVDSIWAYSTALCSIYVWNKKDSERFQDTFTFSNIHMSYTYAFCQSYLEQREILKYFGTHSKS